MIYPEPRILDAGDACLLVEWADEIDDTVNDRVHAVALALRERRRPEITDLVPAYSSLLICLDAQRITVSEMRDRVREILASSDYSAFLPARRIEIPTRYGGEFGPDLPFVCERSGLNPTQVADLHASVDYRVYFVGFAPGFAYMGSVPETIAVPRLDTPRTRVPGGSVGIAGRQTGIYPLELPGGWRVIGWTGMRLFDPEQDPPSLLHPGDLVRFVPTKS